MRPFFSKFITSIPFWIISTCQSSSDRWSLVGKLKIPRAYKFPKDIRSYEYGLSSLTLTVCSNIHKGLRRSFVVNGDFIMAASTLSYLYGFYSDELFRHSWLSLHFPQLQFPDTLTPQQKSGIERATSMITDTMARKFGDDLTRVRASFVPHKNISYSENHL